MMPRIRQLASLLLIAGVAQAAAAQDIVSTTALKNLNRSCGLAVRPGGTADRYEMFIAETGAGRVVRWTNAAPDQASDVVIGFDAPAKFERFEPRGPVALWFLDPGLLVVGTSAASTGELLQSYELPEGDETVDANADRATVSASAASAAVCLSLTRTRANESVADALVLAVGNGGRGSLMKSRVQAGIVARPKPLLPGEPSSAPRALATSPAGRIVVADQSGNLTYYNPIDGAAELRLTTKLEKISGLACSPTTGSLYAADFDAGIYRIDDVSKPGQPACNPVRVSDLKQASALAFAPDGALYVVTFGDGNNGTLQVLTGNL